MEWQPYFRQKTDLLENRTPSQHAWPELLRTVQQRGCSHVRGDYIQARQAIIVVGGLKIRSLYSLDFIFHKYNQYITSSLEVSRPNRCVKVVYFLRAILIAAKWPAPVHYLKPLAIAGVGHARKLANLLKR